MYILRVSITSCQDQISKNKAEGYGRPKKTGACPASVSIVAGRVLIFQERELRRIRVAGTGKDNILKNSSLPINKQDKLDK